MPTIKQRLVSNDKVMMEVRVGSDGGRLSYYTFSLIGFIEANKARSEKGCTPIKI